MIGGNALPFRLGCAGSSGSTPVYFLGFTRTRLAAAVRAFGNTTTMLDHCGNTVTAKERKYILDACGNDICSPNCSDCPGGEDLVTNTPEPPKISENTFEEIGTAQLDLAKKIGAILIQAYKAWHGMFGFRYNVDGSSCTGGGKSNLKYRTITMTASYTGIDDVVYTRTRVYTVARYSGVIFEISCTDTSSDGSAIPDFLETDLTSSPRCSDDSPTIAGELANCDGDSVTTGPDGSHGTITQNIGGTDRITMEVTSTRSDTTYTGVWQTFGYSGGPAPEVQTDYQFSITLSDGYSINDVLTDAVFQSALWSLTDYLKHPFRTDNHTTVAPIAIRSEPQIPVAPNIFEDCGYIDPNADVFDGSVIGAPLAAGYGQPVGGNPRGVFDKDHENWVRRNCDPGPGWTQANESRGGFTPSFLPANAQKWTDDFQATSLYPAAFINADANGIYLQKWVEVKINRPSINFARPYGPDKFVLDETAGWVFFVDSFDSGTGVVTVKNIDFTTPGSLPFTGADVVGSAAVGGFFAVTSVSGNTIQLGVKVSDLPAGWDTPSGDGAACIGRLKYPNAPGMDFLDTTVGIGGRVAVTVTNGSPVTITTATVQKYLSCGVNPETVDILDANMTALAVEVDLARVNDGTEKHFTVTTPYATIASAKWIVPHVLNDQTTTGQKYKFADTFSKGDYVYRTWKIRLSDEAVIETSQQDGCLKFNPCGSPVVAGITPNGESLGSGHFWAFPASINNGEIWLGQIQFWMTDPFWQQPHKPVAATDEGTGTDFDPATDTIVWSEDDGSCQVDFMEAGGGGNTFHKFYPMRPYVEARCTLPDNIGGETPPALASGTDLTAVADPPPQAAIGDVEGPLVDAIILPTPTWSKYLAQKGCVDGNGRFKADYEANGTNA